MAKPGTSEEPPVHFQLGTNGVDGSEPGGTTLAETLTASGRSDSSEAKFSLSSYQSSRQGVSVKASSSGVGPGEATGSREVTLNITGINGNSSNNVSSELQPRTSTPLKDNVRSGTTGPSLEGSASSRGTGCVQLDPAEIRVPVVGFEVMEQRARFTVFKLHVHKGNHDDWYVFRRYSDFTQLHRKLQTLFPAARISLPPKRWFKDNYNREFLEERIQGLQAFIRSVVSNGQMCNSKPVQEFFCFDDPPGHYDSLEESRAYCETLEETVYSLKKDVRQKDAEMGLLREELDLYKSQVAMLSAALREKNGADGKTAGVLPSPASSLAECDLMNQPEVDQSQPGKQVLQPSADDIQSEIAIQTASGMNQEKPIQTPVSAAKTDAMATVTVDQSSSINMDQSNGGNKQGKRLSSKGNALQSESSMTEKQKSGLFKLFS